MASGKSPLPGPGVSPIRSPSRRAASPNVGMQSVMLASGMRAATPTALIPGGKRKSRSVIGRSNRRTLLWATAAEMEASSVLPNFVSQHQIGDDEDGDFELEGGRGRTPLPMVARPLSSLCMTIGVHASNAGGDVSYAWANMTLNSSKALNSTVGSTTSSQGGLAPTPFRNTSTYRPSRTLSSEPITRRPNSELAVRAPPDAASLLQSIKAGKGLAEAAPGPIDARDLRYAPCPVPRPTKLDPKIGDTLTRAENASPKDEACKEFLKLKPTHSVSIPANRTPLAASSLSMNKSADAMNANDVLRQADYGPPAKSRLGKTPYSDTKHTVEAPPIAQGATYESNRNRFSSMDRGLGITRVVQQDRLQRETVRQLRVQRRHESEVNAERRALRQESLDRERYVQSLQRKADLRVRHEAEAREAETRYRTANKGQSFEALLDP